MTHSPLNSANRPAIDVQSIQWPALIKYFGDAELTFVRDAAAWAEDSQLASQQYHLLDRLIAADGRSYALTTGPDGKVSPVFDGNILTLEVLLEAVREHASQQGQCCVAKLAASNLAQAIGLVETI